MEVQGVLRELQCERRKERKSKIKSTVALGVNLDMGSTVRTHKNMSPNNKSGFKNKDVYFSYTQDYGHK